MKKHRPIPLVIACGCLSTVLIFLPSARGATVDHVIHISVDGLHAGHLQNLIANDSATDPKYANFNRFVVEGATTYNARTDFSLTVTIPNHTTMLTGRPVLQPTGQLNTVHHGYTYNGTPLSDATLHNQGNLNLPYVAGVFDVVHDHGMSTSLFAEKPKFVIFDQSWNAHGAPDVTGTDDGTDKIDRYVYAGAVQSTFITLMGIKRYNYSFVHYARPDSVGHGFGWGTTQWNDAVSVVDGYLESIFDLIETNALLQDRTAVILSADHGGVGTGHGDVTDPNNYTIPFFVWGPGVSTGADLYALNPLTRLDPGSGRPDYNAAGQPIRNGDGANLALNLLGLEPIPGSTINGGQTLMVPLPASGTCASFVLMCAVAMARRRRRGI